MRDVLVLGYHAITPGWPAALSIEPERLDAQLDHLLRRGYRGSTFTDAVTGRSAGKTLAVTFDDGLRSVIRHALPVLDRHGLVGTVFVVTNFIGCASPVRWPGIERWLGGPYEPELIPMSWSDLACLAGQGWEIGSHTTSHARLPALDDTALRQELEASRCVCEQRLGRDCHSIAYPYGDVDRRVVSAACRAGYLAGGALPERIHGRHRLRWPRVGIWHNDPPSLFAAKASPLRRRFRDFSTGRRLLLPTLGGRFRERERFIPRPSTPP